MEYKDQGPEMMVYIAIRLEEKRAKIETREYEGISLPELKEELGKLGANLTEKHVLAYLSQGMDSGNIRTSSRREEGKAIGLYKTSTESHETLDELLVNVGFLVEKLTV